MAEYIEKSTVLGIIGKHWRSKMYADDAIQAALDEIGYHVPSADVVPVVRCKDCKYVAHYTDGHMECRLIANLRPVPCTYLTMKDEDFCSYGEKREKIK